MERYLILTIKAVLVLIALSLSFFLLGMRKVALFLSRNYRMITWVDPIGARQAIQGTMGVLTWVISKIRKLIAKYVRSYHPTTWRRMRNYLQPRR